MRQAMTMAIARGSTARATVEFIRQTFGKPTMERVLASLSKDERGQIADARMTDELPYDTLIALWRSADDELRAEHPTWMEEAGQFSIASSGQQLYGGLLRKSTPTEFVTQQVSLFRLYYSPGNVVPVEVEPGRAVLRLVGFDPIDSLFCRRQTGGLERAVDIAGGKDARVKHVRCVTEGDAYCEWELRWL